MERSLVRPIVRILKFCPAPMVAVLCKSVAKSFLTATENITGSVRDALLILVKSLTIKYKSKE